MYRRFRDPELGRKLVERIRGKVKAPVCLMEVCGTHTVAISRAGLRQLLDGAVRFVSGPGCPVCVTDPADIDHMIALARIPGLTVTTFGDMMRVPGSSSSLALEKARGADVRVVYSPLDAVEIAKREAGGRVVFLGVGFETTIPAVALAMEETLEAGVKNFCVLSSHKLVPPALEALLSDPEMRIDGFLYPGHVSTILGRQAYQHLAEKYGVPAAIAGFEPVDILAAIDALVDDIERGVSRVINSYRRAVREEGNVRARAAIDRFFEPVDASWRGLGVIPQSGLRLRPDFRQFDAAQHFEVEVPRPRAPAGCACGEVLKGKALPTDCRLFGRACTPARPVGPCMVSSEGSCGAYYRYGS